MQGLTSGQDEWWSLLAIDFSSAYTEQLLCTAGAEIEFADWGWVALWAALRDWTVGWRERRGWTSALHSICRYTVQSQCACCFVYRTVHATLLRSHPSCDSFAARTLCDLARAAELAQRDETRRVLYAMWVRHARPACPALRRRSVWCTRA